MLEPGVCLPDNAFFKSCELLCTQLMGLKSIVNTPDQNGLINEASQRFKQLEYLREVVCQREMTSISLLFNNMQEIFVNGQIDKNEMTSASLKSSFHSEVLQTYVECFYLMAFRHIEISRRFRSKVLRSPKSKSVTEPRGLILVRNSLQVHPDTQDLSGVLSWSFQFGNDGCGPKLKPQRREFESKVFLDPGFHVNVEEFRTWWLNWSNEVFLALNL